MEPRSCSTDDCRSVGRVASWTAASIAAALRNVSWPGHRRRDLVQVGNVASRRQALGLQIGETIHTAESKERRHVAAPTQRLRLLGEDAKCARAECRRLELFTERMAVFDAFLEQPSIQPRGGELPAAELLVTDGAARLEQAPQGNDDNAGRHRPI